MPEEPTQVAHVQHDDYDVYAGRATGDADLVTAEIGDPGWLGNPFTTDEWTREKAIALFRETFENMLEDPEFRAAVRDLSGQTLGCWCQRLGEDEPACHAEVIAEHAARLARESGDTTGVSADA